MNEVSELKYHTHIYRYISYGHDVNHPEFGSYWHHQAQITHSCAVLDTLLDTHMNAVSFANKLPSGAAFEHLNYGVGRRTKFIWGAFRHLFASVPPTRKETLGYDEIHEISRSLNDIYIHLRGAVDNYAWAFLHIYQPDDASRMHPTKVDLFNKKTFNETNFRGLRGIISPFEMWWSEIKSRRDPVAHQIPLSLIPQILSPQEQLGRSSLTEELNIEFSKFSAISLNASNLEISLINDRIEAIQSQLIKLGTFSPIIVHNPSSYQVPLYPTVPEDIGRFICLIDALNQKIESDI